MNKSIKMLSGMLAVATMFTGCSSVVKNDPTKYPLVPQLSEKEVVDYYKEALDYDTVVSKNLEVQTVEYETRDVSESKRATLERLQKQVEGVLGEKEYPYDDETKSALVSDSVFNYIKTTLDDRSLSNPKVTQIKEALGYYFVDVEYTVGSNRIGNFTDKAALLGLHGAFRQDYLGVDYIDTAFMNKAAIDLNDYFIANRINSTASFDKGNMTFKIDTSSTPNDFTDANLGEPVVDEQSTPDNSETQDSSETSDNSEDAQSNPDGQSEVTDEETGETEGTQEQVDIETPIIAPGQTVSSRAPLVDVKLFNTVVGSSLGQTAYVPKLDIVYSIPETTGTICGYGLYPSGTGRLSAEYGFNRDGMEGSMTLRYSFKDDVLNPSLIIPVNVYPILYDMTTGINSDFDVTIPDFVRTEIEKLIERSDRAISNCDIAGLMSGKIYSDMGKAVLVGTEREYVNLVRNMSTLRRIVARPKKTNTESDIAYENSYVVEVETLRQEGPKGVESMGVYKDTYYMAIDQVGTDFIITDSILMSRLMDSEPPINVDDAITKRLVAMNLVGAIPEENKAAIRTLMSDLYTAGTYRVLNGPKEIETSNGKKTIQKGMYDCFNDDPQLLPSSRMEYLNSELREQLVKYGTDVSAKYEGVVTTWLGGQGQQAELTTEEVITYNGRNTGHYMKVYYLVSSLNDKWVIDERTILEEEDKSLDELQSILSRVSSGVEQPSSSGSDSNGNVDTQDQGE